MEQDKEDNTPEYMAGFNAGYAVAELLPESAKALIRALGQDERSQGFKDGYAEMQDERNKDLHRPVWLSNHRESQQPDDLKTNSPDKAQDIEPNR